METIKEETIKEKIVKEKIVKEKTVKHRPSSEDNEVLSNKQIEIKQYETEEDAQEFVDLLNLYHTFYKRENNLPANTHFFDETHGLKEIQEFKKQSMDCPNSYIEFYKDENNEELLKKNEVIYHLTVNGHNTYTSNNVVKILTKVLAFNMSKWDIVTHKKTEKNIVSI